MLIDDVKIKVKAGRGGDGAVAFNKTKMSLGPTGASGGRGGSVYFEGVSDLGALIQFRYKKELAAEDGGKGKTQFSDGPNGQDLILKVPIGTVVHNLSPHLFTSNDQVKNPATSIRCGDLLTGKDSEITVIGQRLLIAKGGRGGKGNFKFRSSINTTPIQFQEGLPGEECGLRLELKMIADAGFVGLPNVGKSSLLNKLTNAKSKVANYNFTTLEPNLGVYYELILADIPGLIEGASGGKGLGIKFLRHIERTKTIFHFISAESSDPLKDYQIIRNELGTYNKDLLAKPEYIFLSKSDLITKDEIEKKISALKIINKEVIAISIKDSDSIKRVEEILREIVKLKY